MIKSLRKNQTLATLVLIFIFAVFLRLLYFPENIYFGYDQARDAFISQEILRGEFKIVGPTTSNPGLNHGVLFYYLYAPIYFISQSDPAGLAIFLRIYNTLGVFLVFLIGRNLFGKWAGILSALLFAFSYEQTQYALFMTHPALAVITVLMFYLGLTLLLFRKKPYGLIISLLGLGLSFQFHFLLAYLFIVFILSIVIFWKSVPKLNIKIITAALLAFSFSVSTFIVAEIRFGFKTVKNLSGISSNLEGSGITLGGLSNTLLAAKRYVYDNVLAVNGVEAYLLLLFLVISLFLLKDKEARGKIIFLLIWFIAGLISYFLSNTFLYFYGVGTSISLLVFVSFLTFKIFTRSKIMGTLVILAILASNLYLIQKNNLRGPNQEINVQTGMLLEHEKRAIDYIYTQADGDSFAVNALSMPLRINTTWAYLFEWYGQKKYGYLPIWGGENAPGFEGNLEINNSRSTLPYKRFLITEPVRGSESVLNSFMTEESWFTDIIEEQRFGEIIVDYQKPK